MTIHRPGLLTLIFLLCSVLAWPASAQDEEDAADSEEETEERVTDYIAMEPAFVTHIGQPGNKISYLKAAVTIRASKATTRPAVEAHMPRLRHELVMLFGEQTDPAYVSSPEGRQALVEEATRRINQVLEEQQTGEEVAGVFFTEFVVQR
ncbi:flagellar basal body-associated FliL family protein [Marinobacter persicus]|nr:flagellar basal body-associated FliL family protein [Marinobacter persicus]